MLDRLDFGNSSSESAHAVDKNTTAATGTGAFEQTYRQPKLIKDGVTPTAGDILTFTVAVDPVKQNYLTVKLYGSDTQFGVLRLADVGTKDRSDIDRPWFSNQLDNNLSNGPGNPAFYGRFHYATTTLPRALTAGKTSVAVSLYSTGYFYDSGANRVGEPTRSIYSAFTHTDPYFVPPAADQTGTAMRQIGTEPPAMIDKPAVFRVLKRSRANIYNLDGVPDGFWNPGGTLANHGSVIPAGTPGAPPEVIGMHLYDGPVTAQQIQAMNSQASPADAWRDGVVGRQTTAISLYASLYLTPPLRDADNNVVPGYDRYLDPLMLDRLIGLLDGQARSQGGEGVAVGGWDNTCSPGAGWGGVTSTPRKSGPWAGSKARHQAGCLTFADQFLSMGRVMLQLLDHPTAAVAFKAKLSEKIDADLDGKMVTRAAVYQRMLAPSGFSLGFGLKALTSEDYFDKFGGTVAQAMIWVSNAYAGQLALRALLEISPNISSPEWRTEPIDPATMRTIVRQLMSLEDMTFMQGAAPGFRSITRGGVSETYGSLSSGYDGRYGDGVVHVAGTVTAFMKYDKTMTAADRDGAAEVVRRTISAFDHFLYPQHQISLRQDGTVVDTYALGQEDAISWRVPYGPNATGWNLKTPALSVDPNGLIRSPHARRKFLINASLFGRDSILFDMAFYPEGEADWKSIAGVDPATVAKLPGEPGAPDFVWADIDSGAFSMAYQGERLFFNAQYGRNKGEVTHYVRVHHVTDLVDRQATVMMPFDTATVQSDGNAGGGFGDAWVVRYGRYLVVFNRSKAAYTVKLPAGTSAVAVRRQATVTAASAPVVASDDYEVFVLQ